MNKFEMINAKIEKSKEGDIYDRERLMRNNDESSMGHILSTY